MPKLIFVGGNGLCCHKLPLNCGHTQTVLQITNNSATVCSLTVPVPSLDKGGGRR